MKKSYTLRDLPLSERPRERLVQHGAEALSLPELIALILGRGIAGESVMITSQKLISHFGTIDALLASSLEDLQQIKGIGLAKACQIKASLEIARRLSQERVSVTREKKNKQVSPEILAHLLQPKIGRYKKEHFVLVSLDTRNQILGVDTVSIGTLNASLVHPRELFELAIRRHAASVVIAHNHPSGDTQPSDEDLRVTVKLQEAGKILGIQLLDHIIIGEESYFSLEEGNVL